jgi:uncharacterized protein YfaP (DUF2135 family)
MSNLISKSARDLIGIDSPWRGIVWAALMLRAGNVHSDRVGTDPNYPYKNAVRIAGGRQVVLGGLQSFITIEATLPYSSPEALADAGDFLPFVGEYFEGNSPTYTGTACSTLSYLGSPYSGIGEEMPEDDPAVDSLEKYLVWCFLLGELELLSPTPNALLPISLDFLEEAPGGATLKLSAKLFIDYHGYRACNNLVCSVFPPSVTPAVIPPPDPGLDIEWTDILNKPNFATVATSGNYANLTNRPTIPTKTSELENDSNFLDEVDYPVVSVNGMTGAVQITAAIGEAEWENVLNKPNFADVATSGDYADLINPPTIPTKTSDLENDSNFLNQVNYPVTSVNGQTGDVVLSLGSGGGRELLTSNKIYHVSLNGSDNNNGLTNTPEGAFLTFQKAFDTIAALDDKGIYQTKISFTETFTLTTSLICKRPLGGGPVVLDGNGTGIIQVAATNTVGLGLIQNEYRNITLKDFKIIHNNPGEWSFCVVCKEFGTLFIDNLDFGALPSTLGFCGHLFADNGGLIKIVSNNYKISGGISGSNLQGYHYFARGGGSINTKGTNSQTCTITNTPYFSVFANAEERSGIQDYLTTYIGSVNSSTKKYNVTLNSVINQFTLGTGNNAFPGGINGTELTGGKYV